MPVRLSALAAVSLAACAHGWVAVGYDAAKQSRGVMSSQVVDRPATGSVGVGGGGRTGGIELRLQSHDLDPAPAGDRFAAASASLEGRLTPARLGPVALVVHAGPALGVVLDKMMLDVTYGIGFRAGGGVEVAYHGVALWADVARQQLTFGGDVVNGRGDRDVLAVGIRLGGE
jgi:hypothetical protein